MTAGTRPRGAAVLTDDDVEFSWLHVSYDETSELRETYGFAGNQGKVNLEAVLIRPLGKRSDTLFIMMHPASTLQLLPVPRAAARAGAHVLCAGSRYAKNDTALIMEKVALDLGAYIAFAKRELGYRRIVLLGWSGGGSLALFYQSQAERPSITATPAGDPVNLAGAGLIPADAVIFQAAHRSRAQSLLEWIDPSVIDERDGRRDPTLDIYDPANGERPPYTPDFLLRYRKAQRARVGRITEWVKVTLGELRSRGGHDMERAFVTERTMADPRFLDGSIDPNDRRIGWCYMGNPETVNTGPVGLARFSTLRSWLSQWSVDDTNADGLKCAATLRAPLLVIENTADDAVPATHPISVFQAAGSADKSFHRVVGATHYYADQPALLAEVNELVLDWCSSRGLS